MNRHDFTDIRRDKKKLSYLKISKYFQFKKVNVFTSWQPRISAVQCHISDKCLANQNMIKIIFWWTWPTSTLSTFYWREFWISLYSIRVKNVSVNEDARRSRYRKDQLNIYLRLSHSLWLPAREESIELLSVDFLRDQRVGRSVFRGVSLSWSSSLLKCKVWCWCSSLESELSVTWREYQRGEERCGPECSLILRQADTLRGYSLPARGTQSHSVTQADTLRGYSLLERGTTKPWPFLVCRKYQNIHSFIIGERKQNRKKFLVQQQVTGFDQYNITNNHN